ncbi:MAG: PilZ domain-containing protein [Francisellaceae bacterium]
MDSIDITLSTKQQANKQYMPFVRGGGLFVETNKRLNHLQRLRLVVAISELDQCLETEAQVVWLESSSVTENMKYGLKFLGESGRRLNKMIEVYLLGLQGQA